MKCPVCGRRDFETSASSAIQPPYAPTRGTTLGRARLTVEMIYSCRTCGQQMTGQTSVDVVCNLTDQTRPYPLWVFRKVAQEYGEGWDARVQGRRVKSTASISTKAGWRDANQHSLDRGGKPPPKGWGFTRGRSCYLKTKEAHHHMKNLCLESLKD